MEIVYKPVIKPAKGCTGGRAGVLKAFGLENATIIDPIYDQLKELVKCLKEHYGQNTTLTSLILSDRVMSIKDTYVRLAIIGEEERKKQKESLEKDPSEPSKDSENLEDKKDFITAIAFSPDNNSLVYTTDTADVTTYLMLVNPNPTY